MSRDRSSSFNPITGSTTSWAPSGRASTSAAPAAKAPTRSLASTPKKPNSSSFNPMTGRSMNPNEPENKNFETFKNGKSIKFGNAKHNANGKAASAGSVSNIFQHSAGSDSRPSTATSIRTRSSIDFSGGAPVAQKPRSRAGSRSGSTSTIFSADPAPATQSGKKSVSRPTSAHGTVLNCGSTAPERASASSVRVSSARNKSSLIKTEQGMQPSSTASNMTLGGKGIAPGPQDHGALPTGHKFVDTRTLSPERNTTAKLGHGRGKHHYAERAPTKEAATPRGLKQFPDSQSHEAPFFTEAQAAQPAADGGAAPATGPVKKKSISRPPSRSSFSGRRASTPSTSGPRWR